MGLYQNLCQAIAIPIIYISLRSMIVVIDTSFITVFLAVEFSMVIDIVYSLQFFKLATLRSLEMYIYPIYWWRRVDVASLYFSLKNKNELRELEGDLKESSIKKRDTSEIFFLAINSSDDFKIVVESDGVICRHSS
jgi:hypothetical protein